MSYAGSVLTSHFHSAFPIQPLLQHSMRCSYTTSCLQFAYTTETPSSQQLAILVWCDRVAHHQSGKAGLYLVLQASNVSRPFVQAHLRATLLVWIANLLPKS